MTNLRLKLAMWLAPEVFAASDHYKDICERWEKTAGEWAETARSRRDALHLIAAQRTPGSNATVRRICDIADAELGR